MKIIRNFLYLFLFTFCLSILANETSKLTKVEPELPPDIELLAKIAAMPDNTWMKLPPLKITGDRGSLNNDPDYTRTGPMVRDYCNKMVWAPDRKRALYTGGGHNIHPQNDVWEFDLASNTWVCLYGADPVPPRFTPEKEAEGLAWYKANSKLEDGVIKSPRGAPLRPCHTWWSLFYDSDQKRMLFLESHKGFFGVDKGLLAKLYSLDPKDSLLQGYGSGPGESWLFSFYPETKEWKEVLTKVPKGRESSCLEYLSDSKTLWWASTKTYTYDAPKKEWKPIPINGFGGGGETAYDPESKKVVATVGVETWVFDCDTNIWTQVQKNAPDGGLVPVSTFCFDSTAKKFVLYTHLNMKGKAENTVRLCLYDLPENKWVEPNPQGDFPKIGNIAGYYDPERNVTVIYNSKETWVYRCKKLVK